MNNVERGRLNQLPAAATASLGRRGIGTGTRMRGIAIRGEGDPLAVGRPAGTEIAAVRPRQMTDMTSRERLNPDVGVASFAGGDECQRSAVWRQHALIVEGGIVRESLQSTAVDMHPIDVCRTAAIRGEHDPVAVRGKGGVVVDRGS